jgi:NADH:ubiquinone oxidoreductase subunit
MILEFATARNRDKRTPSFQGAMNLKKAKVTKKSTKRREWTKTDLKELKAHSKARTPVSKISKATKRTVGALRAKAFQLGIGLGHQR